MAVTSTAKGSEGDETQTLQPQINLYSKKRCLERTRRQLMGREGVFIGQNVSYNGRETISIGRNDVSIDREGFSMDRNDILQLATAP
jgi:hypothetical protein